MLVIKFWVRLFLFCTVALFFVSSLAAVNLLKNLGIAAAPRLAIKMTRFYSALILKVFGIRVHSDLRKRAKPALYVCNHMSYLDAIAVFSEVDAIFITSTEMRDAPGLGLLCKMANCLFVNRESIWGLPSEVDMISSKLKEGFNVVLFPEGTTSAGHFLKQFKSSLVQAAVEANADVIPLTLNFTKFQKRKPLLEDRDYYCWYGTMEFLPHMLRLCTAPPIELDLKQLPHLSPSELQSCRKTITRKSKRVINERFQPIEITH